MKIEIQKNRPLQKGKPGSVQLLLLDDNREVKGSVYVYPKFTNPDEDKGEFRVEVNSGGILGPLDIKLTI